jgi:hypothetical protein
MSRIPRYSIIILAALIASAGADARTHHNNPTLQPGARASAAGAAEARIYLQCEEIARLRWGTNARDLQMPRDFAYRSCMFDHGIRNP